jgi:ATP synthase protein I
MTTETPRETARARRDGGSAVLVGAGLGTVAAGLLATLAGALVDGAPAAYGALVGAALVVVVFAFGSATVHAVAGLLPAASLVVALLTYALQLLVVLVVLSALDGSGAVGDTLSRGWLAGAVVVGALAWTFVQVALATRVRIPVYELPEPDAAHPSGQAPQGPLTTGQPGGDR